LLARHLFRTKKIHHQRNEYTFTTEWKPVPTISLFKKLKTYKNSFEVICNFDLRPFEQIHKHIVFDKDLVKTARRSVAKKLSRIPFVVKQAYRVDEGIYIFKIINYDKLRFNEVGNLDRDVKVLIYRSLGGLGDIIMTFPILQASHENYVNYDITYACPGKFLPLVENNPYCKAREFNIQLTKEPWDLIVDMTKDCIKYEISHQPDVDKNRVEIFRDACGLGYNKNIRPKLYLSESEIALAKHELEGTGLKIGLVIDANAKVRKWHKFPQLRNELLKKYPDSTILEIRISKPKDWKEHPRVRGIFDRPIREVAALVNECDLVISPDTGIAHISSALRIPTLWIFTHIDGAIRTKNYDNAWYIMSDFKECPVGKPCWYEISCSDQLYEKTPNPYCSSSISVVDVMEKAKEILSIPNISYCVVSYNQNEITERCIGLINKFKKYNDEVILVDNGSEILPNVDVRTFITNDENKGCILARNQALQAARGRHVLTLDNDQYVSLSSIHRLMNMDEDIVGVEAWSMDDAGYAFDINENKGPLAYVGAGGMLTKRDIWEDLGYFDEQYAPAWFEDPDICFYAKEKGYSINYVEDHRIEHLAHRTISAQTTFDSKRAWDRSHLLFMDKWSKRGVRKKPKITIIVDVVGWAWDYKTRQIVRYLSDEFDFEVIYGPPTNLGQIENLFTFECNKRYMGTVTYNALITGVTAHVYQNFNGHGEILKNAAGVHANSKMLYDEVKSYNPNTFYTPNGVDIELFKYEPLEKRDHLVAGFVGKDIKRKGLRDFIIPACEKAGVVLKMNINKARRSSTIKLEDMHEFYEGVDVIIIASDMDGTPNQLLEGAAVGRTFISNAIGNVPEFQCTDNGFIVEREIDSYIEALNYLKENRDVCERMGKMARLTVEKEWTWEHQVENYRNLFRKVAV